MRQRKKMETRTGYSGATIVEAEGGRVGLVSCLRCGATLLLDGRDKFVVMDIHNAWHATARPSGAGDAGPTSSSAPTEGDETR